MVKLSWSSRNSQTEILLANDAEGMGERSARGGAIGIGANVAKAILQLLVGAVLSRLLSLDDFGVFVMAGTFLAFLGMFNDFGMGGATVQRLRVDQGLVSALFWIGFGVGLGLFMLCIALAPAVALLYRDERLVEIVAVSSLVIPLTALGSQHQAIMTRQARWTEIHCVTVASQLVGGGLAIWSAWSLSLGYWALPLQSVSAACSSTALFWLLCRWRPGWSSQWAEARNAVHFGGYIMLFNAVNYAHRQMDNVVVGRVLGAAQLGLYSRGYNLFMMPLTMVVWPIGSAIAPLLSRHQQEPQRFAAIYYSALAAVYVVTAPLAGGLFLFARESVTILYGEKWVASADVLAILAIAILWQPAYTSGGWIDLSLGRSKRHFHASVFAAFAYLAAFAIGVQHGITGMAKAYLFANILVVPPWIWWTSRGTLINFAGVLRAGRGAAIALILAVLITMEASPYIHGDWLLNFFLRAVVYGASYVLLSLAWFKLDPAWSQLVMFSISKLRPGG